MAVSFVPASADEMKQVKNTSNFCVAGIRISIALTLRRTLVRSVVLFTKPKLKACRL